MEMDVEVSFKHARSNHLFSGRCIDLSHTGLQFETSEPVSEGEILSVTIDLGNDKFQPMKAVLDVKRVEITDSGQYRAAGQLRDIQ